MPLRAPSHEPRTAPRRDLARVDAPEGETAVSAQTGEGGDLKAGDLLVQRGTIHNWVNKGTAPCVIAFVQLAAKPVTAGGNVLNAIG